MKIGSLKPPRVGEWLLKHIARYDDNISLRGDFDEEFDSIARSKGFPSLPLQEARTRGLSKTIQAGRERG